MILPICLKCMDAVKPSSECSCGNLAVLIDEDNTLYLYVEDIRTTRLAEVGFSNETGEELYRELKTPFELQPHINYKEVKDEPLNFKDYIPRNTYERKGDGRRKYDTRLMDALDKYSQTRASEGRIGTTKTRIYDPLNN